MPFPLIPLIALASVLGGGYTLGWYTSLSPRKRKEADQAANNLAISLFKIPLDRLNSEQAKQVEQAIKKQLEGKKRNDGEYDAM